MKRALIVGGTRGIGAATAILLQERGWNVHAVGRYELNIDLLVEHEIQNFIETNQLPYDAMVFSAGDLTLRGLAAFAFPIAFYRLSCPRILNKNASAIAISSVAAIKPAKVNADYAAAKSALEHFCMTLRDSSLAKEMGWKIDFIRFDLVYTETMRGIPPETMTGRVPISAAEAANRIVDMIEWRGQND